MANCLQGEHSIPNRSVVTFPSLLYHDCQADSPFAGFSPLSGGSIRLAPDPVSAYTDLRTTPVERSYWHPGHCAVRLRSDRKSTRLNSSHVRISYAVFCLKKKKYDRLLDELG